MEFCLLGPVEIRVGHRSVGIGTPQQRLTAAILAANANRSVALETMIDRLWNKAPTNARHTVYVLITHLRRLLERITPADQPPVRVVRRSGGYALAIEPERVDIHRFHRLVARARVEHCSDDERARALREAITLWVDTPLSGIPGEWAENIRNAWGQEYLDTALAWANAELAIGNHSAVLGPLTGLVREHPLGESLAAALIRAQYAAGFPAKALDQYLKTRRLLVEELGTEPGPDLQQAYHMILSHAGNRSVPVRIPNTKRNEAPTYLPKAIQTLPADVVDFVGRPVELGHLLASAADAATGTRARARAIPIYAVDGMAGVGKTALAIHAAHRLANQFPDGQRFVALHAHTPGRSPVDPAVALDTLLQAEGIAATQIPSSLDARVGLWRDRMARKRLLLVLDDARDTHHLAPLLPGAPECLVLITSRRRLTTLPNTVLLSLEPFSPEQAVSLFLLRAGRDHDESAAVRQIAAQCGNLPLAITLAAARLRTHPTWSITDLANDLATAQNRLAELASGDLTVAGAINLSYQDLSKSRRRLFRRLGLHPGLEIDVPTTAALDGTSLPEARRGLEDLLEHNLITESRRGRYRLHQLVAEHARALATREADRDQVAAHDQLLNLCRCTSHDAHRTGPLPGVYLNSA